LNFVSCFVLASLCALNIVRSSVYAPRPRYYVIMCDVSFN